MAFIFSDGLDIRWSFAWLSKAKILMNSLDSRVCSWTPKHIIVISYVDVYFFDQKDTKFKGLLLYYQIGQILFH